MLLEFRSTLRSLDQSIEEASKAFVAEYNILAFVELPATLVQSLKQFSLFIGELRIGQYAVQGLFGIPMTLIVL